MTVSTLWLTPEEKDDGEVLTCKAGLPNLPQSTVQNSWNLQVNCRISFNIFIDLKHAIIDKPKVQLAFGSQLEASNIKEGNDVYFECKVKSHPRYYKITWKRNVSRKNYNRLKSEMPFISSIIFQTISGNSPQA